MSSLLIVYIPGLQEPKSPRNPKHPGNPKPPGTQRPQEPKGPRDRFSSVQLLEADGVTRLEVDVWQGAGGD